MIECGCGPRVRDAGAAKESDEAMFLKSLQQAKRFFKVLIGFTVLLLGVIMLVTPGPGWVAIALGLALLAGEFMWARRLLDRLKEQGVKVRDAVFQNSPPKNPTASSS